MSPDRLGPPAPSSRAVLASPAHASAHRISAIGHAHIDSAWLWPVRETIRKVARTVANVVALMDEDPTFRFAMSQAQQLAWLRDAQPALFARVQAHVASGQFVPVGGMWVESDTNLPGGESLARQFVHGKRFFLEEFGIETEEVWLPDSFGYSAALPQLIRRSGSRWFLSQKLSWNQTNAFPHHTFLWEGIDGTRVFSHFPPVDTYNSELSGAELAHAARQLPREGSRDAVARAVRVGRRRRRPDPRDARRARTARRTWRVRPAWRWSRPRAFFGAAEAEYAGRRRCGRASCTSSSTAGPTPPRPGPSRATAAASTCSARRSCGRRPRPSRAARLPVRRAGPAVEDGAAAPVPRHPARHVDRLGAPRGARRRTPGSPRTWRPSIGRALQALAGDGDATIVFNAAPHAWCRRARARRGAPATRRAAGG